MQPWNKIEIISDHSLFLYWWKIGKVDVWASSHREKCGKTYWHLFDALPNLSTTVWRKGIDGIGHVLNHFQIGLLADSIEENLDQLRVQKQHCPLATYFPTARFVYVVRELYHTNVHMQLKFTGSLLYSLFYQRINLASLSSSDPLPLLQRSARIVAIFP